ncbi:MAG: class I SAM-dependent methyltransferase [Pseudomonadota bacterium]
MRTDNQSAAHLALLQSTFDAKHRFCRGLIGRALESFGRPWAADFERTLESLLGDPATLASAAKGYAAFAFDSMRRQKAFESAREYPNKTYEQAAAEVYFNEKHMAEEYLPGLLLSHYLWPHHYRQIQFFDTAFLAAMALEERPVFAEVGVGTGLYSRRILERLQHAQGAGYDISPSSCAFAARHIAAVGASGRYDMRCQDILAKPMEPTRWLICVEVLEHLEDPVSLLRALKSSLAPGGRAFITAALNAAHADHIYLYRNAEEVWQHLDKAGFALEQSFVGAAYPPPAPGIPVPLAAAFVVS